MRLHTVIGINPKDRKREQRSRVLNGCQNPLLTPVQEGEAFGPSRGHIGEGQRVQVAPFRLEATMGHEIRSQKAGLGLIPLLERTDRDLLLKECSRARRGEAAQHQFSLGTQKRSAVAALMESSWLRISSVNCRCPCCSGESIKLGRNGIMRLAVFQARNSACWTSGPSWLRCAYTGACSTSSAWLSNHIPEPQ